MKNRPGLVKTPLDELTYKVNGLAMQVHRELKAGHREVFYQRRLAELCRQAELQVEMEKRVEVWVGEQLVGYLYIDLWIEDCLVVECKALNHDLTDDELSQVLVYLAATGAPVGMLYNFGQPSLEFRRVLRPQPVQDWQKYLFRFVWTPRPAPSFPASDETSQPIRFSVVSPFALQSPVIQSVPASETQSVPVRESVKKSEEKSAPLRESANKSEEKSVPVRESANKSEEKSAPLRESVTESVNPSAPLRESAKKSVNRYAASGVSIDAGNRAVELMWDAVRSTYGPEVLAGIGAFGGLYDAAALKGMQSPVLVASTDGVGTKVKLAAAAGRYRSIGHDIVNHCIDDILVQGARPLFFLDYFATAKLEPQIVAEVVTGISEACRAAGMALLGGETAEMPGVYAEGEFDLAGTIVGVLEREFALPRPDLRPGDLLVGLRSSGPHTNGYSLIRRVFDGLPLETVFPELGISLADALLEPHRSYLSLLWPILSSPSSPVKALAHLTGGGFVENIPRLLPKGLGAVIRRGSWPVPPLFDLIRERGGVDWYEMHRVFNMGIGMVAMMAPDKVDDFRAALGESAWIIGELVPGECKVILE